MAQSKEEIKKWKHEYYLAHKEKWTYDTDEKKDKHKAASQKYVITHPQKRKESTHKYDNAHKERAREYQKKHYAQYKDRKAQLYQERYQKARGTFLEMYGGKCECCGETESLFLAIDHIQGQKGVHRTKKENGYPAYKKAILKLDRSMYRILCHNCNFATRYEGSVCPHQLK